MKRLLLLALVVLWSIPQWAASAVLTTNGSSCPGTTNTTAIVVNLPEDKGGATLTVAGTWTGTISFYGTGSGGINGGGIWTALSVLPIGSSTAVTSTTANGTWQVNVAGFTGVCMLSSASMTGSATVTITPSAASARSNGGSSSGGSVSITATAPIVVTPSPLTGTGVASAPSLVAVGSVPACSTIATAVLNGTITQGVCYTQFSNTQMNSLQVQSANTIPIGLEPPSGKCTTATSFTMTYDAAGSAFTNCQSVPNTANWSLGWSDQTGDLVAVYQTGAACVGFMDQSTAQVQFLELLNSSAIDTPVVLPISDIAGEGLTLANSGDIQTTGGAGSHVNVIVGFAVIPCPN